MSLNIAITGTNRGIGLGLVKKYLSEGSNVIAFHRNPISKELLDLNNEYNKKCILIELDVSSKSSHQNAMKLLLENNNNIILDILICNAGIASKNHPIDPPSTCEEDDMINLYQTNVIGTMFSLQTFSPLLSNNGLIMVMSSRLASIQQCVGLGGYLSYRCSKVGLNMLAQTFAEDSSIKEKGIKVLACHPGLLLLLLL